MNKILEAKLKTLPRSPGVYFHKNKAGEIIYVGKAAVLKNRVRQYFQSGKDFDVKTRALVAEIVDTEWLETESEIDALFLESEMVKRYMPRYNILLRDDKSQMYVRIDMKSEWPHVSFTRNPADDGAEYYGPYFNGYALKKALRYLRKTYPYFTKAPKSGQRPSLDAHLGLEPHNMGSKAYKAELRKLVSYIKGNRVQLVRELEAEMKAAAKAQDFEAAVALRNRLYNLRELKRRIMFGDREFLDISKDRALGKLKELFGLEKAPARIEGFDISHMSGTNVVASQVVFINGVSSRADYRKYKMSKQKNDDYANMHEVIFRRMSAKNRAAWGEPNLLIIDGGKGQLEAAIRALKEQDVNVPVIGIAKREEEIILHRTHSGTQFDFIDAQHDNPDIWIETSGEFVTVNLHPLQRNASSHSKNLRASTGAANPYSDVIKLFQRIRDESHRFAVSYHTTLKRQGQTENVLERIPGVGPATRKKLLKKFGSVRGLSEASEAQLVEVVGEKLATTIRAHIAVTPKERAE